MILMTSSEEDVDVCHSAVLFLTPQIDIFSEFATNSNKRSNNDDITDLWHREESLPLWLSENFISTVWNCYGDVLQKAPVEDVEPFKFHWKGTINSQLGMLNKVRES